MKRFIIVQIFFVLNFVFCTNVFAKTVKISKDAMNYCFMQYLNDSDKFFDCCNSRMIEISDNSNEELKESTEESTDTSKNIVLDKLKPKIVGGRADPSLQQTKKLYETEMKSLRDEALAKFNEEEKRKEEEQKLVEDGKNKLLEILDKVRNDNKGKVLTQDTYNTDVLDYRTVDLSKMSEQQACQYWKGEWKDNTCTLPHGTYKGRFSYIWEAQKKMFKCLSGLDRYQMGLSTDKNYADEIREWTEKYPNKWKNVQWDPVIEECGSQHERDCRDSGDVWDWETGICYKVSNNRHACESVGAVFKENNDGTQTCDCVVSDREFHFKSSEKNCRFKMPLSGNYTWESETGSGSGTQSSTVESCINGLKEKDFFQGKSKLKCK